MNGHIWIQSLSLSLMNGCGECRLVRDLSLDLGIMNDFGPGFIPLNFEYMSKSVIVTKNGFFVVLLEPLVLCD